MKPTNMSVEVLGMIWNHMFAGMSMDYYKGKSLSMKNSYCIDEIK